MKILVIGNGGREHTIAWKVSQNPKVEKVYCAPGNGGTYLENKCENVAISTKEEMLQFALDNKIDLTIVGPEAYLCDGIVDLFKAHDLKIFGPSMEAAKLEGSKSFAKAFMKKYGVKTAEYEKFTDCERAVEYIKANDIYPIVIKADGLAAGKGVIIAENREEALNAVENMMVNSSFGSAGSEIIIEEFLEGVEVSILSITDGNVIIPFVSSKDHKTIYEGNKGPNTGGMGTIAPNPYCTDKVLKDFESDILKPTLKGIQAENMDYKGIIFFGLMITSKGVYLLEYNVRMGDPETQVVLSLMDSDLVELIEAALNKKLQRDMVKFSNKSACCVVGVSKGYPGAYEKGKKITGMQQCGEKVFVAGAVEKDGDIVTSGGRVIGVTAVGDSIKDAAEKAYKAIEKIHFDGIFYRKDISE